VTNRRRASPDTDSGVPHSPQNFCASGFSLPQDEQVSTAAAYAFALSDAQDGPRSDRRQAVSRRRLRTAAASVESTAVSPGVGELSARTEFQRRLDALLRTAHRLKSVAEIRPHKRGQRRWVDVVVRSLAGKKLLDLVLHSPLDDEIERIA